MSTPSRSTHGLVERHGKQLPSLLHSWKWYMLLSNSWCDISTRI